MHDYQNAPDQAFPGPGEWHKHTHKQMNIVTNRLNQPRGPIIEKNANGKKFILQCMWKAAEIEIYIHKYFSSGTPYW